MSDEPKAGKWSLADVGITPQGPTRSSTASLDLPALARETADQLVFYINGETAEDYPASYDIILSALQRVRGHQG